MLCLHTKFYVLTFTSHSIFEFNKMDVFLLDHISKYMNHALKNLAKGALSPP